MRCASCSLFHHLSWHSSGYRGKEVRLPELEGVLIVVIILPARCTMIYLNNGIDHGSERNVKVERLRIGIFSATRDRL